MIQKRVTLNYEPSEISWNTKTPNLVGAQLVRLAASGNFDQPGGDLGTKSRSNCGAGRTPCFVAVEQEDDFFEVVFPSCLSKSRPWALFAPQVRGGKSQVVISHGLYVKHV